MALHAARKPRPALVSARCPARLSVRSAVMPARPSAPASVTSSSRRLLREQKSRCVSPACATARSLCRLRGCRVVMLNPRHAYME